MQYSVEARYFLISFNDLAKSVGIKLLYPFPPILSHNEFKSNTYGGLSKT